MRNLSALINEIKRIKGLKTDGDVAELLGIKEKTLATAKFRNSIPYKELISFCRKEEIPLDHLFFDQEPELGRETAEGWVGHDVSYGNGFVSISQVEGKLSTGGGFVADNTIEMRIAFRRDWISRKGDPHHMRLIRVKGDSMEPTLSRGDLVLIDLSRNYVDPNGGIYAIAVGDEIMAKRLEIDLETQKIRVISDNPTYPPKEIEPDRLHINGKVIWFARDLER